MAQNNLTVPTGSGLDVRVGFNNAIQALASRFAGATDPASMNPSCAFPYMIWPDTGTGYLKQRTADNTEWVEVGVILEDGTFQFYPQPGTINGDVTIEGKTMLAGALHQSNPVNITSSGGVITLTEASNSFVVDGTEPVTSINGWTTGIAIIRWNTARTLTYNATGLIIQGAVNRATTAGDIGMYEMTAIGAREIGYFPATVQSNISFPLGTGSYTVKGRKVSSVSGFQVNLTEGQHVINNTPVSIAANAVTIPARSAVLIYDKADGTTDKVLAQLPYSYIDNNTVGFWDFTNWDGTSTIPNAAVGYNGNTLAIANPLTKNGTVTRADGWQGYGAQCVLGTTGYFTSANYTNFPSGTAERELNILVTYNGAVDSTNGQVLAMYGNSSTSGAAFGIHIVGASREFNCTGYGTGYDKYTGYVATSGNTYLLTLQFVNGLMNFLVNGVPVITNLSVAWSTVASQVLYVGSAYTSTSMYSGNTTFHFVELRNKCRTPQQIAQIANTLLLPNFYTKSSAAYPTVFSTDLTGYHEWRFDETSGSTIADSNTASSLTAAAIGTTIVDSPVGLGKARKFNGTSDYVTLGSVTQGTAITIMAVVQPYTLLGGIFENRQSSITDGVAINITPGGAVSFYNGNSNTSLTSNSILSLNNPNFVALTAGNGNAALYVNSANPDISTTAAVGTLVPSTHTAYIGQLKTSSNTWGNALNAIVDYYIIIPRALPQSEIAQYYNALMKTGRQSITDILPTNAISLGFVRTNSSGVVGYNDSDYQYGRREKAYGGNRRVFLGWKYFNGSNNVTWINPFGTRKIKTYYTWAQDAVGTNECEVISRFLIPDGTSYGIFGATGSSQRISVLTTSGGIVNFNNVWQTAGYIGCYAEVLEDDN